MDNPDTEGMMNDAIQDTVRQFQEAYDEVLAHHGGDPVEVIKPILKQRWNEVEGGDLSDPQLTEYAESIARRETVTFEPELGDVEDDAENADS